jgi:hypothetical protein
MSVTFDEWLTDKYLEWRGGAIGQEKSVVKFAAWLGVSHQLVRDWMKPEPEGKHPKHKKSIDALVRRYGDEAYTALGLPVPSKDDYIDLEGHSTEEVIEIIQRLAEQHGLEVVIHRDEKSQKGKS